MSFIRFHPFLRVQMILIDIFNTPFKRNIVMDLTLHYRAFPRIPEGTFREINDHGKNRNKECQFILHFLDSPYYQQITKKNIFHQHFPHFVIIWIKVSFWIGQQKRQNFLLKFD